MIPRKIHILTNLAKIQMENLIDRVFLKNFHK